MENDLKGKGFKNYLNHISISFIKTNQSCPCLD